MLGMTAILGMSPKFSSILGVTNTVSALFELINEPVRFPLLGNEAEA